MGGLGREAIDTEVVTDYLVKKAMSKTPNQSYRSARRVLKEHLNERIDEIVELATEIAGHGKRITPIVIREAIWRIENGDRADSAGLVIHTRDRVRSRGEIGQKDIQRR